MNLKELLKPRQKSFAFTSHLFWLSVLVQQFLIYILPHLKSVPQYMMFMSEAVNCEHLTEGKAADLSVGKTSVGSGASEGVSLPYSIIAFMSCCSAEGEEWSSCVY